MPKTEASKRTFRRLYAHDAKKANYAERVLTWDERGRKMAVPVKLNNLYRGN